MKKFENIFLKVIEQIELPKSYYEKAEDRYDSLGNFLSREGALLEQYDPEVFVQGSFMLGTVVKPVKGDPIYDLDMSLVLTKGITKQSHTQDQLRKLVKEELELYKSFNNIKKDLEEKRRCVRVEYSDNPINFHMDIVPGIPANERTIKLLRESFNYSNSLTNLEKITSTVINITDNEDSNYFHLTDNWRISNPKGYSEWFKERVELCSLNEKTILMERANVESMPKFFKPSVLQKVIQIFKRHRDVMFKDDKVNDSKPISIIINTLAAKAYMGESNILDALINISKEMGKLISNTAPRIPNPVHPSEDFADKWSMAEYSKLNLEGNFKQWLTNLNRDLESIINAKNLDELNLLLRIKLEISIVLESPADFFKDVNSKEEVIKIDEDKAPKPWLMVKK